MAGSPATCTCRQPSSRHRRFDSSSRTRGRQARNAVRRPHPAPRSRMDSSTCRGWRLRAGPTPAGRERRLQLSGRIFAQAPAGLPRSGCCHRDDEAVTQGYAGNRDRNADLGAAVPSDRVVGAGVLYAFQMPGFVEHPKTKGVVHWLAVVVAQHYREQRRIENERP
jgi:hypothetical protein